MHHFHRRLRAALVLLALQIGALTMIVPSAQAHPYGPLQIADVSTDGDRVVVTWHFGATDDISYLGAALEALPAERTLLDGVILYQPGDEDLLTRSPRFSDYLTEHIVVRRAGKTCAGEVQDTADLVEDGIPVAFSCPAATGPVSITIDMLFDLHPAYRTLATSADGQRGEYIAEDATHEWDLTLDAGPPGEDRRAAPTLGLVSAGAFVVVAGATWWRWRRVSSGATLATRSLRHL